MHMPSLLVNQVRRVGRNGRKQGVALTCFFGAKQQPYGPVGSIGVAERGLVFNGRAFVVGQHWKSRC